MHSNQVTVLVCYVSQPRLSSIDPIAMLQMRSHPTCFIDEQILDLHRPEVGSLNVECVIALVEQILAGHPGDSICSELLLEKRALLPTGLAVIRVDSVVQNYLQANPEALSQGEFSHQKDACGHSIPRSETGSA